MTAPKTTSDGVAVSLKNAPIIGVIRTDSTDDAARQAELFRTAGLELIEVTFTVPGAIDLVKSLVAQRGTPLGPPWIGMGTVTSAQRARDAVAAGCDFLVSPNTSSEVAAIARDAGCFLILGAMTPSEIVAARQLGANFIKVYPLPMFGGPAYLHTVRQPLPDIPFLAAGGFDVEEIPDYVAAGAQAFGIGAPLLGENDDASIRRIQRALQMARGAELP
jgi:2-dehydro-3-deoxyphosphogluconate aldolase/(4S)-4-hydroxy-2-oxoglutarate aldolase